MKKNDKLIWSLIVALGLMVVIAGVMLLQSYNANKSNQKALTELEANLSSVSNALEETKTLANEKSTELENQSSAYQRQIGDMQRTLDQTAGERDALQTQMQALTEKTEQAAKETQDWQARYDAASAELDAQKKQTESLNAQIAKLQSDLDTASTRSAAEQKSVSDALAKAHADLQTAQQENEKLSQSAAALKEQLNAAAGKEQALNAQIQALQEELEAAKTIATKDAEQSAAQVTALSEQLKKAQEDLDATNQKVENLTQTIADLNEQLTAAKTAADKDAKQSVAQIASLNEKLTNAQTQLEAARKEKEERDQTVAALNDQLVAAQAAMISDAQQATAKAVTLNEQLSGAKAQLESVQKEKETLEQSVAALNEQLIQNRAALKTAVQEKENLEKTIASLEFQLNNSKASAEEQEKIFTAQAADLNETRKQLDQAQKALAAGDQEKEQLNAAGASLTAQLNAARDELAQAQEQLAAAASAQKKEKDDASNSIAALEEKNQALTAEAAALRGSLDAETQKNARLQEELDVQSAQPEALQKRLEALKGEDGAVAAEKLDELVSPILRAFRESIPADPEDGTTYSVPASVLIDGQEVMTISYYLTKSQEAKAYEAAKQLNDSQTLYQIDLNHDRTAALIVNGTAFGKEAFEAVYAEAFSRNPAASQEELRQLTAEEMTKKQVLQEHAEAMGLDAEDADMESKLWEEALKNVAVSEADFSAALRQRQTDEDAVLASDPAAYARMLEEGRIASPVLPEGSRFVKQLIVPVDISELDKILPELERFQKELDAVNAKIDGQNLSKSEMEKLQKDRNFLAKQVSQLNSDRKLLLTIEQRAKDKAADLGNRIRTRQITFDEAADLAMRDDAMPAVGYAVFSGAPASDEEWTAAALALESPGDASAPIRLSDGYHVLYYSEEITAASAVIQGAQETLGREMLSALRDAAQENLLNQWIDEAEVVLNVK